MIWLCLIVPIVSSLILHFFYKKNITALEFSGLIISSVIFILICKIVSGQINTIDTEYWNGWVSELQYYEEYTTIETYTTTDSKGHIQVHTKPVYHGPEYKLFTSNNEIINVNKEVWIDFLNRWGPVQKRWSFNPVKNSIKPSQDGPVVPIVRKHTYRNKIQSSNSIYKFEKLENPEESGVYDYPKISRYGLIYNPIMGSTDEFASHVLKDWNARLGAKCQVHMMICIYQNKPLQTFYDQRNYWQGGNKNEFTVCIGMIGDKVDWCEVLSWTDVEDLKTDISFQARVLNPFDLVKFINNHLGPMVEERYVRKQFSDFDFINIEPSLTSVVITFIMTIIFCVGVSYLLINNDIY